MTGYPIWRLNLKGIFKGAWRRGDLPAVVVIAETEEKARSLAANCTRGHHDDANPYPEYLDPEKTDCVMIGRTLSNVSEMVLVADHDYDYVGVNYEWAK